MQCKKSDEKPDLRLRAFVVLFIILSLTNIISMVYDSDGYAVKGFSRILIMSVLTLSAVIAELGLIAVYVRIFKHSKSNSVKERYFTVSLCCIFICLITVFRGSVYIRDLIEGPVFVAAEKYWYYMGKETIEFTDDNGDTHAVSCKGFSAENKAVMFFSQISSDQKEKKKLYIMYYPSSSTITYMRFQE